METNRPEATKRREGGEATVICEAKTEAITESQKLSLDITFHMCDPFMTRYFNQSNSLGVS
jgi:hypothetical protein